MYPSEPLQEVGVPWNGSAHPLVEFSQYQGYHSVNNDETSNNPPVGDGHISYKSIYSAINIPPDTRARIN